MNTQPQTKSANAQAIDEIMQERARLIERKYSHGLTAVETERLDWLNSEASRLSPRVTPEMLRQVQTKSALDLAEEALQKLACLGNGDRYGNSDGNVIAQEALAAIQKEKEAPKQEPVLYCDLSLLKAGACLNDCAWAEPFVLGTPLYTSPQPKSKLFEWRSVMPKYRNPDDYINLSMTAGYNKALDNVVAALKKLERGE